MFCSDELGFTTTHEDCHSDNLFALAKQHRGYTCRTGVTPSPTDYRSAMGKPSLPVMFEEWSAGLVRTGCMEEYVTGKYRLSVVKCFCL